MAERALQLDEAHRRARRDQRMDDLPRFPRRIEPVRVERDDAEAGLRALEGVRQQAAMLLGQIEIIHRPGDVEIGIGVEPLDKAQPLKTGRASCRERVWQYV